MILCFGAGGLGLGFVLQSYYFMATTAYLGAFLVFRGFGTIFGNYPNVLTLAPNTKLPNSYYMYLGLIVIHAGLGFVAQFLLKKKFPSTEDEAEFQQNNENDKAQPLKEGDQEGADNVEEVKVEGGEEGGEPKDEEKGEGEVEGEGKP